MHDDTTFVLSSFQYAPRPLLMIDHRTDLSELVSPGDQRSVAVSELLRRGLAQVASAASQLPILTDWLLTVEGRDWRLEHAGELLYTGEVLGGTSDWRDQLCEDRGARLLISVGVGLDPSRQGGQAIRAVERAMSEGFVVGGLVNAYVVDAQNGSS